MENEIKPGDTVVLKSGGPEMTVDCYYDQDKEFVYCSWFDKSDTFFKKRFSIVSLEKM